MKDVEDALGDVLGEWVREMEQAAATDPESAEAAAKALEAAVQDGITVVSEALPSLLHGAQSFLAHFQAHQEQQKEQGQQEQQEQAQSSQPSSQPSQPSEGASTTPEQPAQPDLATLFQLANPFLQTMAAHQQPTFDPVALMQMAAPFLKEMNQPCQPTQSTEPAETKPAEPAATEPAAEPAPGEPAQQGLEASFVKDVTIEDGTAIPQGTAFTKVWRLQNTGSSDWPADLEFQPVADCTHLSWELGGGSGVAVESVKSGQTVDVSLEMTTPSDNVGDCTAYFRLLSKSTGQQSAHHFWVTVHVTPKPAATEPAAEPIDLATQQKLSLLREMGFIDDAASLVALGMADGRIEAATELLLH